MDNKQRAQLAHEANLKGKILIIDGDSYRFEDPPEPEQPETETGPTIEDRLTALEEMALEQLLEG